jgi:hypothetical protein
VASATTHRAGPAAILCVAVLALATACGSSSSKSTATPPATATTSSGGGGLSDSAFCDAARKWGAQFKKQVATLSNIGSGPSGLKAYYTLLGKDYAAIVAAAPSDIKPSVAVLYADFQKLTQILASSNYDIVKAGPELEKNQGLLDSAKTRAAIARIDAWATAHSCTLK